MQIYVQPFGFANLFSKMWSGTRKGGWAIAQSPILGTTITLERLRKRSYEAMLDYYSKVSPQLNEPPPERTGRAVYATRTGIYPDFIGSGVRGAPHRLQAVRLSTRLPVVPPSVYLKWLLFSYVKFLKLIIAFNFQRDFFF